MEVAMDTTKVDIVLYTCTMGPEVHTRKTVLLLVYFIFCSRHIVDLAEVTNLPKKQLN